MRIGKSGFLLNVYKTEQGGGGAQVRGAGSFGSTGVN